MRHITTRIINHKKSATFTSSTFGSFQLVELIPSKVARQQSFGTFQLNGTKVFKKMTQFILHSHVAGTSVIYEDLKQRFNASANRSEDLTEVNPN